MARLYSVALASAEEVEVPILGGGRAGILNPCSVSLSCHRELDEKASCCGTQRSSVNWVATIMFKSFVIS